MTNKGLIILSEPHTALSGWYCAAFAAFTLKNSGVMVEHRMLKSTKSYALNRQPATLTLTANVLLSLDRLGISESVLRCNASALTFLANRYKAWTHAEHDVEVGIAPSGLDFYGLNFCHYYSRYMSTQAAQHGIGIEQFSLNSLCARQRKFDYPSKDTQSILSTLEYGLQVNTTELVDLLEESALYLGVVTSVAARRESTKSNEHWLFIDCTEADQTATPKTELPVDTWCNLTTEEYQALTSVNAADSQPFSPVLHACDCGVIRVQQTQTSSQLRFYSSKAVLAQCGKSAKIPKVSRWKPMSPARPFNWQVHNFEVKMQFDAVMALQVDLGLESLHTLLSLLFSLLPPNADTDANPLADYFNREARARFKFSVDQLWLPFKLVQDKTSHFWTATQQVQISEELAHLIELFGASGCLPSYEHYPAKLPDWINLFLAFDYVPKAYDPLTLNMSDEQLFASLQQLKNQFAATVQQLPSV